MKQFFLAIALIAAPVAAFSAVELCLLPGSNSGTAARADPLGDLSTYQTIVSDTRDLVQTGKLGEAETRITDFETEWDEAEPDMRPKNPSAWGNVDAAADKAFAALRARNPDPAKARNVLSMLSETLAAPSDGGSLGGVQRAAGVAVTDPDVHAIPCEALLDDLRAALADGAIPQADASKAKDLQAKAVERCNADDDTHADEFAARALSLASN